MLSRVILLRERTKFRIHDFSPYFLYHLSLKSGIVASQFLMKSKKVSQSLTGPYIINQIPMK
jgi:hypothetical protein